MIPIVPSRPHQGNQDSRTNRTGSRGTRHKFEANFLTWYTSRSARSSDSGTKTSTPPSPRPGRIRHAFGYSVHNSIATTASTSSPLCRVHSTRAITTSFQLPRARHCCDACELQGAAAPQSRVPADRHCRQPFHGQLWGNSSYFNTSRYQFKVVAAEQASVVNVIVIRHSDEMSDGGRAVLTPVLAVVPHLAAARRRRRVHRRRHVRPWRQRTGR